jgi:hypothetical protein
MLITNQGKVFEKPDTGSFLAVIADVVYVKDKPTKFGPKNVVRIVWILNAKDKEGNYYRVMTEANQSLHENARLYSLLKDIRGGVAPPVPFDPDDMIGTVKNLVIVREKSEDGTKDFANIKAYLPLNPGQTFAVPQGFVRQKDKPAKGTQPAQDSAPAPQQQSAPASVQNTAPVQTTAPVQDSDIPF